MPSTTSGGDVARSSAGRWRRTARADVEVRPSPVHGRGLYVTREVPAGEVVSEAPALVLHQEEADELADHRLAAYLVAWDRSRSAVPFGALSFVNHGLEANAELVVDHDEEVVSLVTTRAVAAGEELTIDYGPEHPV
ncbi:SET domain-containing protein [Nitriliruptoraceae bacterium ZYF776]|nr:SET domain-containing protein [Profundirhabdus halotolerans]